LKAILLRHSLNRTIDGCSGPRNGLSIPADRERTEHVAVGGDPQQVDHQRNAQDIYSPVYVNVIGPGTAHVVHYRTTIPKAAGRELRLRARLLWRKFDRAYTEFAYRANPAGFRGFHECPKLPITEICRTEVTLPVLPSVPNRTAASPGTSLPDVQWLLQTAGEPDVKDGLATTSNGKSWLTCRALSPGSSDPKVEPSRDGAYRTTYNYAGKEQLTLIHMLQTGDGAPGELRPAPPVNVSDTSVELTLDAGRFRLAREGRFEISQVAGS